MKRLFLTAILALSATTMRAQTANCILFTEQGEKFTVILNGQRMNESPQTNVKIEALNAPNYKLKVIFDNPQLPAMDKNLYVSLGEEVTYNIKRDKKGEFKLGLVSQVPIAQAPKSPPTQYVYVWGAPPPPAGAVVTEQTTTTTTTTTSGGTMTPAGDGVNMNMNVNENGMGTNMSGGGESVNMGVSVSENGMGTTMSGGGETVNMGVSVSDNGMNMNINISGTGAPTTTTSSSSSTVTTTTTTTSSGTSGGTVVSGTSPCYYGMDGSSFEQAKSSIKGKTFEDSKLTLAKQILNTNCLTSQQVKEIVQLFEFEETRLDYAKFAYGRTVDPSNYYLVNDAFEFETTIEELDAYINSR